MPEVRTLGVCSGFVLGAPLLAHARRRGILPTSARRSSTCTRKYSFRLCRLSALAVLRATRRSGVPPFSSATAKSTQTGTFTESGGGRGRNSPLFRLDEAQIVRDAWQENRVCRWTSVEIRLANGRRCRSLRKPVVTQAMDPWTFLIFLPALLSNPLMALHLSLAARAVRQSWSRRDCYRHDRVVQDFGFHYHDHGSVDREPPCSATAAAGHHDHRMARIHPRTIMNATQARVTRN